MPFTYRLFVAAVVCLGLLSVVVAFATRTRREARLTTSSSADQGRFEAERITLREWGFEPKEINRPAGPFFLVVQNQSGLAEVELTLVQESGHVQRRLPDTRNALTWKQRMELPPGTYLMKENGHPEWQCRITIGKKD